MRKIGKGSAYRTEWILISATATIALLMGNGCTPTMGTCKLIDQSMPGKPAWTRIIPQSRTFEYFVGVSDNRESLEEAKKAALADAFADALGKSGIEVTVNYAKLTDEERRRVQDEIQLTGRTVIGLEQLAWYNEQWECYYAQGAVQKHRAFVLTRSRKLKRDSIFKMMLATSGQRFDAVWHSMLIPGWGQFRYGRRGEGNLYLWTEVVALGGLGYLQFRHEKFKSDIRRLEKQLAGSVDPMERQRLTQELSDTQDSHNDIKRYRRYLAYGAAVIYGVNLVDALIFGPPSQEKMLTAQGDRRVRWSMDLAHDIPRMNLAFRF